MVRSNCYQICNFLWHGENILELHSGDGFKLCEETKITWNRPKHSLNICAVGYVNFVIINLNIFQKIKRQIYILKIIEQLAITP